MVVLLDWRLLRLLFVKKSYALDFPNPPCVLVFRVYLSSVRCVVYRYNQCNNRKNRFLVLGVMPNFAIEKTSIYNHNINIERNKKMNTLNYLGLDEKKVQPVVNGLSQLLADFQVFYANLRGLHWNVKGKRFFSLHAKYEELYNDAAEKIDEIAERLLQLGATPENRFSEYLKVSSIKETGNQPTGKEGVETVLNNLSNLIKQERELSKLASEIDDNATVGLIDGFLEGQEKTVWMLVSFLDKSYKK